MKTMNPLIHVTLFLFSMSVYAQKEITVTAVTRDMSRGQQPGYMVNIPEAKVADVKPSYKKRLDENTKADSKEINGELINYGVVNKNFSMSTFIVYAKMVETIDGVELTAFVSEDSLNFINESSAPEKVAALKQSLHEFAVAEYKKVVTKQLNAENVKLNELKKTLDDQVSEENKNTKEISEKQREIDSYKAKIEESKADQAASTEQIGKQQQMLEKIGDKNSPEYGLASKNLKKHEGEKRDHIKSEEKLHRNIDDTNTEIRNLQNENEDLKKQQEDTKQKIAAQQTVLSGVENKFNGIK